VIRRTAALLFLMTSAGLSFGSEYSCRNFVVTPQLFYATSTDFSGEGRVECYSEYGSLYKGEFAGRVWVVDETVARTVAERFCSSCFTDIWVEGLGGATVAGHCYRSRVSGSSPWKYQEGGSAAKCVPSVQPPPGGGTTCTPTETNPCTSPGTYNYRDCGYFYGDWTGCTSPIVINADNGRYALSGPLNPVSFDLDADGAPDVVTWTAPASGLAFLARDRNQNGRIDDGGELFGNHTRLAGGTEAANGFDALSELDLNHDGAIDDADSIWSSLLLWTDRNHDGKSSANELEPITASAVHRIDLRYHWIGRRDQFGNMFRYQAHAELDGGARRPIYDVFFRVRE